MLLKKLSFRLKLILLLETLVIFTNLIFGTAIWREINRQVREISRQRLIAIASTTAAVVDIDKHEAIQSSDDKESANYQSIQLILQKIQTNNPEVDDIYTLRHGDRENIWNFVVGANGTEDENGDGVIEDSEEGVEVGEEFDVTNYPEMQKAFFQASADYETNCDKWGCWLSGYAPLIDSNGQSVAIVGVDVSADNILSFERESRMIIFIIFSVVSILFPIILYFILNKFVRSISLIISGIEKFTHDLSTRITIRTGDEFEVIAGTFNMMAQEIQQLYSQMESRIREKTKELSKTVREIQLEKAEDEAILSSIGEGMLAIDKSGKIIMLSQQSENILGMKEKDIIGKNYIQVFVLTDSGGQLIEENIHPVREVLAQGMKLICSDHTLLRSDGQKIPIKVNVSPVIWNKKVIGAIMVFRDTTEEKRIDQAKSEFVSLASHQLRTPLSSIHWYTEMLLDEDRGKLTAKQKEFVSKIFQANSRMTELVNSLLNVSRIELGAVGIDIQPVNLESIVKVVIDEIQPVIKEKEINLEESLEKITLSADPQIFQMIIGNLLSNAVKYTPLQGKVKVNILQEKEGSAENVLISVSDTGCGIPKDQQDKIFTKLFRADNAQEIDPDGNGLGLYIVKSIVEESGGQIWFDSQENKGTTFYVKFPTSGMKKKKGTKKLNL